MTGEAVDREMYCPACGLRAFTSLAPALVDQRRACSRCDGPLQLAPALDPKPWAHPIVTEIRRAPMPD